MKHEEAYYGAIVLQLTWFYSRSPQTRVMVGC